VIIIAYVLFIVLIALGGYLYFIGVLLRRQEKEILPLSCFFPGSHKPIFLGFGKEPRKNKETGQYIISRAEIDKLFNNRWGIYIPDKYCYFFCDRCLQTIVIKTNASDEPLKAPVVLQEEK